MSIVSMSKEGRKFPPKQSFSEKASVRSLAQYNQLYQESIAKPEQFWARQAAQLHWFRHWDSVFDWNREQMHFTWFRGGKLNVSYNCLDRHLATQPDKPAIIWQGDIEDQVITLSYRQLHQQVCRFANVLKAKGMKKGDRACVYLPMIPEAAVALLACARIGVIHSVVFAGFSTQSLRDRIQDSQAKLLITADGSSRAGKQIPLKQVVDEAAEGCDAVQHIIVVDHLHLGCPMKEGRDSFWQQDISHVDITDDCPAEQMDAEDPLFILYTSGTTGKPKGVLHTTGGYLTYVHLTFRHVFDYKPEDIYWCTADIGWITGHSYILYGPLSNGATTLMFEGVPTWPDNSRFWKVVEKFKVSVFYTAPTAIRALMKFGEEPVRKHDLSSLRLLGSVGEPINPEAWMWYHDLVGGERCPVVDTWWQTETGGILITPLPGATTLKPGSATKPFFGIEPVVYTEAGRVAKVNEGGYLAIRRPWPGLMRTVWGDHKRYIETYWSTYPHQYFTGDSARMDADGDFWIMGRMDDVIKVSGHRIGTAEVESAVVSHHKVAEAAVVPRPHDVKGQCLYIFVTLKAGVEGSEELKEELKKHIRHEMGPIAVPDVIQFADALPKTRSGKIMRRILRAIAEGKEDVGNTTTLADPEVVDTLIRGRVA